MSKNGVKDKDVQTSKDQQARTAFYCFQEAFELFEKCVVSTK